MALANLLEAATIQAERRRLASSLHHSDNYHVSEIARVNCAILCPQCGYHALSPTAAVHSRLGYWPELSNEFL